MTRAMNSLLEQRAVLGSGGRPVAFLLSSAVHFGVALWFSLPYLGGSEPLPRIIAPGMVHIQMVRPSGPVESSDTPAATVEPAPSPPPETTSRDVPKVVKDVPPPRKEKKKKTKPKTEDKQRPTEPRSSPPETTSRSSVATSSSEQRRTAAGGGQVGIGAGGSALQGLDGQDFRYSWYLDRIISKINAAWQEPLLDSRYGENYRVTVYFIIHRNGSVSDLRVEQSSDISVLDLSAIRAIREAAPLPPLPQDYRGDSLGVHFWFEYERD